MSSAPHPALLLFAANPDHAILLLLCGILFIYAEFNKPGSVVYGCFGALMMMLALYGLSNLPLAGTAILVSLISVAIVVLGCRFATGYLHSGAGAIGLIFGLENLSQSPRVHPLVAIAVAIIFSFVTSWLVRIALRARQNKSLVGPHALLGKPAVVRVQLDPAGEVEVRGEIWPATLSRGGFQPHGASVSVVGVHDLQLLVVPNTTDASSAE